MDGDGSCEASCETATETCNGLDDDCDGVCNNGFECCAGTSDSCTTSTGRFSLKKNDHHSPEGETWYFLSVFSSVSRA
ncbi:MAG: hypothetical protein ABIJ56_02380 [Pseudomonadota bacterium]